MTAASVPSGCRHCGIDDRRHVQRWSAAAGWHLYSPPSQEQIKKRMLARRLSVLDGANGEVS